MAYTHQMDHFIHTTSEDSDSNDCEDEYESDYSDEKESQEPLIWMTSSNGNEKPFYNLYSFHLDYCKSGKNYWKCDKCKMGCKARIHTVAGSNEFLKFNAHSPLQSHNHDVNRMELSLARVRSSFREVEEKRLKTNQIEMAKCEGGRERKAKVNFCFDKLKRLLTHERFDRSAKLEKADILEMTVTHMENLRYKNEQLLQKIQQFSQINNGQLTHLNTVPEVMSADTNTTFGAYSQMRMADTLSTAEYPEALLKNMRDSLNNTHMNFQFNLTPNCPMENLPSFPLVSSSESETQQHFFSNPMPTNFFPYFPEPLVPDSPQRFAPSLQYNHHLSLMQQIQPAANFQPSSLPDSVSNHFPNMQLQPGLMPASSAFSNLTGPSALVPMTTPFWKTNAAFANDYLLQCNQGRYPAAPYNDDSHSYDPSCRTGTTISESHHLGNRRHSNQRAEKLLKRVKKPAKKMQIKSLIRPNPKQLKQSRKPCAHCKCKGI